MKPILVGSYRYRYVVRVPVPWSSTVAGTTPDRNLTLLEIGVDLHKDIGTPVGVDIQNEHSKRNIYHNQYPYNIRHPPQVLQHAPEVGVEAGTEQKHVEASSCGFTHGEAG